MKQRIQSALDVTSPDKPLASNIVDQGCDSRSSVGLQTRISCSLAGYRYFELTADKKTVLREIDAKLKSLGFKKQQDNNVYVNDALDGVRENEVSYIRDRTSVQLGWSTLPAGVNGPASAVISRGLSSHWISNPDKPTAVVGVIAQEGYFYCSSGGIDIWGIGACILPPHPPNR
ncbi:hypothetical protein L1857_08585 [Amycolatopsis thermalba]|uniref:Uncharacterized protein n=1 Tax=Amycolatopsis thermalba TaxID=944492 RepID=A0ABY4NS34_9PSEU|nr:MULTISPECIES: hypothetical protein [Amycolatopsis]UQS22870.1 hypothetical protein L1857_08585 [Amycolatopsis thermalba]